MSKPSQPASPVPVLDPVNDGRHLLEDKPLARESIPYVISLPEHDIAAFSYTWVDKANQAGSVMVVFGDGAAGEPAAEKVDGIMVDSDDDFDDWRVGALHMQHDLQLQNARLAFNGERIGFDARFEAIHPAYAYSFHPDGCPHYMASDRTEQVGRLHGKLKIDGRELDFDTTCARDHSWGTRDWQMAQHWKWLHAQVGQDVCVHFMQIYAAGRIDLRGYVFRDGVMAHVASVEVTFGLDDRGNQSHIEAVVLDSEGRTTRVKGEYFATFPLQPIPEVTLNEGAMRCEVDGRPGVGWTEFHWPTAYLEHLRSTSSGT